PSATASARGNERNSGNGAAATAASPASGTAERRGIRSACPSALPPASRATRSTGGCRGTPVPLEAVHAGLHVDVHRANHIRALQEFHLACAQVGLRPQTDRRSSLGVRRLEIPIPGVPLRRWIVLPKNRRSRVEESQVVRRSQLHLFERRDVV